MPMSTGLRVLALSLAAAFVAVPAIAQESPLHINRDARFAVIFPGEPMTREIAYTTRPATPFPRGSFSSNRMRAATR